MDESSLNSADVSSVSLRQLEGFLEVARTLNFRRAAESLYLTQPSLSRQIRTLEGHLGVVLFERSTRSVRLTPQGERLVPLAAALIAEVVAGIELAQEVGAGTHVIRVHHCAEASAQATRVGGLLRERRPAAEVQQHEATESELRRGGGEDGREIRIIAHAADRREGIIITTDPIIAVVPEASHLSAPGDLGLDSLAAASPCALGTEDAPGLRAALELAGIDAEVVENGAEAHALDAGRIVIDLASRWGLGTQQFVRRPVTGIDEVTFAAETRSSVLDAMLREILGRSASEERSR